MDPLRKLFHSASYGKISTEQDQDTQNGRVIHAQLVGLSSGFVAKAYRWDGDMPLFIGQMGLAVPTTFSMITVQLEDGTPAVAWTHGKES